MLRGNSAKSSNPPAPPLPGLTSGGKNGTAASQKGGAERIPYARIDTLNEFVRGEAPGSQPPGESA